MASPMDDLLAQAASLVIDQGCSYGMARKKLARFCDCAEARLSDAEIARAIHNRMQLDTSTAYLQFQCAFLVDLQQAMRLLVDFSPRAVGDVAEGMLHKSSLLELHLSADTVESVLLFLDERRIECDLNERVMSLGGKRKVIVPTITFLAGERSICLWVCDEKTRKQSPVSLLTAKAAVRLKPKVVDALLMERKQQLTARHNRV